MKYILSNLLIMAEMQASNFHYLIGSFFLFYLKRSILTSRRSQLELGKMGEVFTSKTSGLLLKRLLR